MTATELIKQVFQGRDAIALIVNDEEARRVLVAWKIYRPDAKDFEVRGSDNPVIVLNKLWLSVGDVDMAKLASDANVPETRCAKIFSRLKNAALIYPDGTLQIHAGRLVDAEMESHIQSVRKNLPRPPVPPPPPAPPAEPKITPRPAPPKPDSPAKKKKKRR